MRALLFALMLSTPAFAQRLEVLADVNPLCQSPACAGVAPTTFKTPQGAFAVFPGTDGFTGTELWRTDGTEAGTSLLLDLQPGAASSNPTGFIVVGSLIFFAADDGTNGNELWRTDGTMAGTQLVKNIAGGGVGGFQGFVGPLGNRLVFSANDGTGTEPWVTDGTLAGTVKLADLTLNMRGSSPGPGVEVAGTLYFPATNSSGTRSIFRSTGMGATETVPAMMCDPTNLFAADTTDTKFYFNDSCGRLWRFDGTVALSVGQFRLDTVVKLGNALFYLGEGPTTYGVHKLDPQAFIPQRLDFDDGFTGQPSNLLVQGNQLVFVKMGLGALARVWTSDGTVPGTQPVATFGNDGTTMSNVEAHLAGSTLVFSGALGPNQRVMFRSDFTDAGTFPVWQQTTNPGGQLSSQVVFGNKVLFFANDGVRGLEPWVTDGTVSGTRLAKDLNAASESGDPRELTPSPFGLLFSAVDPLLGRELFVTNGLDGGTRLMADVWPGLPSSAPRNFLVSDAGVFFFADDALDGGFGLFSSTGTGARKEAVFSPDASIVAAGRGVAFEFDSAETGHELALIPAPGAPRVIVDVIPGTGSSLVGNLLGTSQGVYFAATAQGGRELWLTDNSDAGAHQVDDVCPSACNADPVPLLEGPFGVIVSAFAPANGRELYRVTNLGLALVADVQGGAGSSNPQAPVVVGSVVYFTANTNVEGRELWITNGSPTGTRIVRDVRVGLNSSAPAQLTALDGTRLIFTADDGVSGRELWITDGTDLNTRLIRDFVAGPVGSNPQVLAVRSGVAFFTVDDAARGRELWRTDGTELGTKLMAELVPGINGSNPTEARWYANSLITSAGTPLSGRELWRISDVTPPQVQAFVIGQQGDQGWYVGDVEFRFDVQEEFFVESSSGCATSFLTVDSPDASVTCTATSPGGTTTVSVNVRRDTTAPRVPVITAPDGGTFGAAADVVGTTDAQLRVGIFLDQEATSVCDTTSTSTGSWRCNVPFGQFDAGTYSVSAIARDEAGNVARSRPIFVTVDKADTRAPDLVCPSNQFRTADTNGVVTLDYLATAVDDRDPLPTITSTPAKGAMLPVGSNTVTVTATDASRNTTQCSFVVSVVKGADARPDAGTDVTPPVKKPCGCSSVEGLSVLLGLLVLSRRRR